MERWTGVMDIFRRGKLTVALLIEIVVVIVFLRLLLLLDGSG